MNGANVIRDVEMMSYSLLFLNKKQSWSRAPGSRQKACLYLGGRRIRRSVEQGRGM
jgi:hypothetical protein